MNQGKCFVAAFLGALSLIVPIRTATAASIPIVNFSFENPAQVLGGFSSGVITGWTAGGATGVFHTTAGELAPPTDGLQVGYINTNSSISQILSNTLTANSAYTLTVDFLARIDCCAWPTLGAELDFMAGSTVLASNTLLTLAAGGVQSLTVNFTALPSNPNLGQALQIRISNLGPPSQSQVNVDNVRLDGTIVSTQTPEPGSTLLVVAGLLLVAVGARRRRGGRVLQ